MMTRTARRHRMVNRLTDEGQGETPADVADLLRQWSGGDAQARDRLIPLVYDRLKELAHQRRGGGNVNISLTTTAIVHETYMRLVAAPRVDLSDRAHFLALAGQIMRNLLIDHARARLTAKRGSGAEAVELAEASFMTDSDLDAIVELHEALERLAALNPRQSQMLEHRYFGGLSLEETSAACGVSLATVKRELRSARAWLAFELQGIVR
jgi:RNA polymerase sigma factor (TIGR02999 family)